MVCHWLQAAPPTSARCARWSPTSPWWSSCCRTAFSCESRSRTSIQLHDLVHCHRRGDRARGRGGRNLGPAERPFPGHHGLVIGLSATPNLPPGSPRRVFNAMSCDRWRPTSPRLTPLAGAPELPASARRTPSTGTTLPRRGGCRAERPRIMTAATTCCRWSRLLPCPPSRPSCHRTGCTGCNGGSGSGHARLRIRNGRLASAAKSRLAAPHHGFRARPR